MATIRPRREEPTYSLCSRCKIHYDKRYYHGKFCEKCGADLIQNCPLTTCKAKIESQNALFCKYCGTSYSIGDLTQK